MAQLREEGRWWRSLLVVPWGGCVSWLAPALAILLFVGAPTKAFARRPSGKAARLLRALSDSDARIRARALARLEKRWRRGKACKAKAPTRLVDVVSGLLSDKAPKVRLAALRLLSKLAPVGIAALFEGLLRDADSRVRRGARLALAKLKRQRRSEIPKRWKKGPAGRVKVHLGDARASSPSQAAALRAAWRDELRTSRLIVWSPGQRNAVKIKAARANVVVRAPPALSKAMRRAKGKGAYELGSRVLRTRLSRKGSLVRVDCRVEAWLGRRDGALLLTSTGGAMVELTLPEAPSDELRARLSKQALRGAVASARRNIERFLASGRR